jgi:glycosyltransferase involved in cell wall biosynthesis
VSDPSISVVAATHDRAYRLSLLLDALRSQRLPRGTFEVIIVDDGSRDATPRLLADAARAGDLDLRVLRCDPPGGPAAARNAGWRTARAPLVAFTDDDCRPSRDWLAAYLDAAEANPGTVLQGRVEKDPDQLYALSPFAHTYEVLGLDQGFATANMLYPRELLERLGGFDESFRLPAGEDTDLGWRAIEAGARIEFAPEALVYHGIVPVGAIPKLRATTRWASTVRNYPRHPGMTKVRGVFWRHNHWELFRFLVGLALPRRLGPVRLFLAAPYVQYLTNRRTGPLLAPYLLALDLAEVLAIVRGAVRYRVFVL